MTNIDSITKLFTANCLQCVGHYKPVITSILGKTFRLPQYQDFYQSLTFIYKILAPYVLFFNKNPQS